MNRSTASTDSESVDKDHDLSSTVESRGHEEVVLSEPSRSVLAEVVLREYGEHEGGEYGAVDSDTEVSKGP